MIEADGDESFLTTAVNVPTGTTEDLATWSCTKQNQGQRINSLYRRQHGDG